MLTSRLVVQGVYVLTDNLFRPFSRMSTAMGENAVPRAEPVRPGNMSQMVHPARYCLADPSSSSFGFPAVSSVARSRPWASTPRYRPRRPSCRKQYSRSRPYRQSHSPGDEWPDGVLTFNSWFSRSGHM